MLRERVREPTSERPILLVAHPRACSSAFERIFIQNHQHVDCFHEPFGDAYWLGPERQGERYEEVRGSTGLAHLTYKSVVDGIKKMCELASLESKRLFIKDMAFFLFPSPGQEANIAQSFGQTNPEPQNPTMLPRKVLEKFHFTFLIRHPRLSVPSYYRLSLPPHKDRSRVREFDSSDLGYSELRRLFDYLRSEELVGPTIANSPRKDSPDRTSSSNNRVEICVVDAEDLLNRPDVVISAYCRSTGITYDPNMLHWEKRHDQKRAASIINRWGFDIYFHKTALDSKTIQCSAQRKGRDNELSYQLWIEEFGIDGAEVIRNAVESQLDDYNHLKQFALVV
ncbi:MAG: hypothetical protein M1839_005995 [Geoglossum umbratile]|nr:MAG: hypothetical protein M1839_005995 [Geoglossum umbratile]